MTEDDVKTLRKKDTIIDGLDNEYVLSGRLNYHVGSNGVFYTVMATIPCANTKICLAITKEELPNYTFKKYRK
jgi:hypothetical protein